MQEFSRRDHTITFVDTCPSELIHTLADKILIFSHINYDNIEIDQITLRQFKDTRTEERKLKMQEYVINCFETKKITGYGVIHWNSVPAGSSRPTKRNFSIKYLSRLTPRLEWVRSRAFSFFRH